MCSSIDFTDDVCQCYCTPSTLLHTLDFTAHSLYRVSPGGKYMQWPIFQMKAVALYGGIVKLSTVEL